MSWATQERPARSEKKQGGSGGAARPPGKIAEQLAEYFQGNINLFTMFPQNRSKMFSLSIFF